MTAEPFNCQTCSGNGATDLVPVNKKNTEKHYNKYGNSLKIGVQGNKMGATCGNCGGTGKAK